MEITTDVMTYINQILGTPYIWWKEGDPLSEKSPFWVSSDNAPFPDEVRKEGCNCAGFLNLLCRKSQISIPGILEYGEDAGGTYAWFKALYNDGVLVPIQTYNHLESIPVGSVLLRDFKSEKDQGHVVIVVSPGIIAHCWPESGICIEPLSKSHSCVENGYYTHVWPFISS